MLLSFIEINEQLVCNIFYHYFHQAYNTSTDYYTSVYTRTLKEEKLLFKTVYIFKRSIWFFPFITFNLIFIVHPSLGA